MAQRPANTLSFDQWLREVVAPAMTAAGVVIPQQRAMLFAMCEKESVSSLGYWPSTLARTYNNLFGVKWRQADKGRYKAVNLAPNQFENKSQWYRVYRSPEHAIEMQRINIIDRPQVYAEAKEMWERSGHDYEVWLGRIGPVYCPDNPRHTVELIKLYHKHLGWAL